MLVSLLLSSNRSRNSRSYVSSIAMYISPTLDCSFPLFLVSVYAPNQILFIGQYCIQDRINVSITYCCLTISPVQYLLCNFFRTPQAVAGLLDLRGLKFRHSWLEINGFPDNITYLYTMRNSVFIWALASP